MAPWDVPPGGHVRALDLLLGDGLGVQCDVADAGGVDGVTGSLNDDATEEAALDAVSNC